MALTFSLMIVFFLFFLRIFSAMASHYRDSLILVFTVVGNNCIVVDKSK
jgi:hypothetical protein